MQAHMCAHAQTHAHRTLHSGSYACACLNFTQVHTYKLAYTYTQPSVSGSCSNSMAKGARRRDLIIAKLLRLLQTRKLHFVRRASGQRVVYLRLSLLMQSLCWLTVLTKKDHLDDLTLPVFPMVYSCATDQIGCTGMYCRKIASFRRERNSKYCSRSNLDDTFDATALAIDYSEGAIVTACDQTLA